MKRMGNLYKNICKIDNITLAYKELTKNTRNKNRVAKLKDYKALYICHVYQTLVDKHYVVKPYNEFTIYEPKERRIISQNLEDKIIKHLVARYILYPAILPCLLDVNVAVEKNITKN